MNIALDFDGTYTRDALAWNGFIGLMRGFGHKVYVVTMRYGPEYPLNEAHEVIRMLGQKVDAIYFTGRKAKRSFMAKCCIDIHVWIDDQPEFVVIDAAVDPHITELLSIVKQSA